LQTPTFKAEVEYVEVDALVTDSKGQFVRDLTKEDFQVFEDKQRQTISTFSLVDIPVQQLERPLSAEAQLAPRVTPTAPRFGARGCRPLVYFSGGIDYDITASIRQYDAPSSRAGTLIDDIRQTINAAARSNVSIYAIDPRGLTNQGDISIGVAGWADAQAGAADPNTPTPDATGIG